MSVALWTLWAFFGRMQGDKVVEVKAPVAVFYDLPGAEGSYRAKTMCDGLLSREFATKQQRQEYRPYCAPGGVK